MTLFDALDKKLICVPLKASDKDGALDEMIGVLSRERDLDEARIREAVMEREKLGSTAIGNGVAIPHCKCSFIQGTAVVVGVAERIIPYDENEVRIVFLVVANDDQTSQYIQLLSSIARFCSSSVNRNLLASARSVEAVYQTIDN